MGQGREGIGRQGGVNSEACMSGQSISEVQALPSRPRKSGLPDLRTNSCETRASPGFVAGRVARVREANAGGVGGLHFPCPRLPPTPNPSPPRASQPNSGLPEFGINNAQVGQARLASGGGE